MKTQELNIHEPKLQFVEALKLFQYYASHSLSSIYTIKWIIRRIVGESMTIVKFTFARYLDRVIIIGTCFNRHFAFAGNKIVLLCQRSNSKLVD